MSTVPARTMPSIALWTASKASLLNFRLIVIAYLHQSSSIQLRVQIHVWVYVYLFAKQDRANIMMPNCVHFTGLAPVSAPQG
ncbi:hypothetical protein HB777_38075 (plasmid) [Mesorhizobium loti]|nr:hypothetical protein HB777_38075 [Mesorhizobium loti]